MTIKFNKTEYAKEYYYWLRHILNASIDCLQVERDKLVILRGDLDRFPKYDIDECIELKSRVQPVISNLISQFKVESVQLKEIESDVEKQLKTKGSH